MKTFLKLTSLLPALMAIIAVSPASAQEQPESSPFCLVLGGSATGYQGGDRFGGSFNAGFEVSIDDDIGLSLRTLYKKFGLGETVLESQRITALWYWYRPGNWAFYLTAGGDVWTDGPENNVDALGGVGAWATIYRAKGDQWLIPFKIDVFADVTTSDLSTDGVGTLIDIHVGLRFTKPVKRE